MIEIWGGFRLLDEFSKALMPENKVSLPSKHIAQNLDKTCQRSSLPRTLIGAQQLRVDGQQRVSKQTYS